MISRCQFSADSCGTSSGSREARWPSGLDLHRDELADVLSDLKPGDELLGDVELEAISGGAGEALSSFSLPMTMQRENTVFTTNQQCVEDAVRYDRQQHHKRQVSGACRPDPSTDELSPCQSSATG